MPQYYAEPIQLDTEAWVAWAVANWQILLLGWIALNAVGFLFLARNRLPKAREDKKARQRVANGAKAGDLHGSKDE